MRYLTIGILVLFSFLEAFPQEAAFRSLPELERELQVKLDSLRSTRKDADRIAINRRFLSLMKETLEQDSSYYYPFDSLKSVARLSSPDGEFRIINWNVESDRGDHSYFGFIQLKDLDEPIPLIDQSERIREAEEQSLDPRKWYGCLYYDIIPSSSEGRKEYVLLGWDGNNRSMSRKIMEVIVLSGNKVTFGAPIFYTEKDGVKRRILLEHSAQASISIKYDPSSKLLIFDHLTPETPAAEGVPEFYYPDGSYDAYKWENGKWKFVADVDARRGKDKKDRFWNDPKKNE